MTKASLKIASPMLIAAWVAALFLMTAPSFAQYQGSSSAGETTSMAARGLKAPQPFEHLVVTAVSVDQGKIKLQHQRQGWDRWFELSDDTVLRSASDKAMLLSLSDVQKGQPVSVFIARKLLGGKTVYLNIGDT